MRRFATIVVMASVTILMFQNCSKGFTPISSTNLENTQDSSSPPPSGEIPNIPSTLGEGYDIIVVAGQSNGQGAGQGSFSDDKSLDNRIFQLGRYTEDKKIIPATDDLQHWLYPVNKNLAGIGMPFAREYAKTMGSNRKVLLIPAAKGATSILQWANSEELYTDMKDRVLYALSLNSNNRIVAFLWHQGETDIMNVIQMNPQLSTTAQYSARLQTMIQSVRRDFKAGGTFPVLIGDFVPAWIDQVGVDVRATKALLLTAIQNTIATNQPAYFVQSMGLYSNYEQGATTSIGEQIHFSGAALIEFGKRYYEVFATKKNGPTNVVNATSAINSQFLTTLGRTQTEINQDLPGLSYWVHQYLHGLSINQIRNDLLNSDEYFVRQAYFTELKRRADFEGLLYFLKQISSGAMTRQQVQQELRNVCLNKIRGECL